MFEKFDQKIMPPSDRMNITPYAINKAVKRDEKREQNRNQKKGNGFQGYDNDSVDTSINIDNHDTPVFSEDHRTWVPLKDLLGNARVRYRVVVYALENHKLEDRANIKEVPLTQFQAIGVYQRMVSQSQTENKVSFDDKVKIAEEIETESYDELVSEKENLEQLIPGIEELLAMGVDYMPLIAGQSFLNTITSTMERIGNKR